MTLEHLKIILGYSTVQDMLNIIDIRHKNASRIKADNPTRYKMIVNDIILKHHGITTDELIQIIKLYKIQNQPKEQPNTIE